MKNRLLQIAQYYNLSIRAFELKCGLQRGNISNMAVNGSIGADKLTKIHDTFPAISLEWLLTGKGAMISDDKRILPSHDTCSREEEYKKQIEGLNTENEYLKREIKYKDQIIESLIKALKEK